MIRSAASQADLLRRRVPIDEALKDPKVTDENKRKLLLARDARVFAEAELGLATTQNYTTFVQLDRPYVTYVVSAAKKNELKHFLWSYPLLGDLPYRGYFDPQGAKDEAADLKKQDLDVYVRGVSAYSTLGWFRDPVLSSMLAYKDHDLVNTIIHETVHATIYIKSEADFNERLAMFIGNKGTELFYAKREGESSAHLKAIADDAHDDKVFTTFISKELDDLDHWYADQHVKYGDALLPEPERLARLKLIQTKFKNDVRPQMKSALSYKNFEDSELNNARLLTYRLYFEDLSQFEIVFQKLGGDFRKMLEFCKGLERVKDPVAELNKAAAAG